MQSQCSQLGGEGDTQDRTEQLMNQHELGQEYLYRLWKDQRIHHKYVKMWTKALCELQTEADCDYFAWLMKRQPLLVCHK